MFKPKIVYNNELGRDSYKSINTPEANEAVRRVVVEMRGRAGLETQRIDREREEAYRTMMRLRGQRAIRGYS